MSAVPLILVLTAAIVIVLGLAFLADDWRAQRKRRHWDDLS